MNEAIERAAKIIEAKQDYIGEGMDGVVVLTLIDEDGYPTSSAASISKAEGIAWMSFLTDVDSNKVSRLLKNRKASVAVVTNSYNINLVGTVEIIIEPEEKEKHWQPIYTQAYQSDFNDEESCVLKFVTERYSLFFSEGDLSAEGRL